MGKRGKLPKWAIKQAGGINKKAWRLARRGKSSTRRRKSSPTAAAHQGRRRMKRRMPHPSITGLASGAMIAHYLNQGANPSTTVIGALKDGNLESATNRFLDYAPALVTSKQGQKTLIQATGIAILGAMVRKHIPNIKLGGSSIYARI